MKTGIMGLPKSGKTTVFNALTGQHIEPLEHMKEKFFIGTVFVNDERINYLSEYFKPKKTTYPEIQFIDYNIQSAQDKSLNSEFIAKLKECQSMLKVIRAFENPMYPPALTRISPIDELKEMDDEIMLNDMLTMEKRLEKLKNAKYKLSNAENNEIKVLEKFHSILSSSEFLSGTEMSEDEQSIAKNYGLLSSKYDIIVINAQGADYEPDQELTDYILKSGRNFAVISAHDEMELNELDHESRAEFAADMHISKFAKDLIAEKLYYGMNLITFLTTGEDEVKGWTIREGTPALKAAGKIHSDIERGFIKASVVAYDDFRKFGSFKECSKNGVSRLEGKEYAVRDGDMIEFKFNV